MFKWTVDWTQGRDPHGETKSEMKKKKFELKFCVLVQRWRLYKAADSRHSFLAEQKSN